MQKIGEWVNPLPKGTAPDHRTLGGHYAVLERLSVEKHGAQLYQAMKDDPSIWTYLFTGPYASQASFIEGLAAQEKAKDAWFYAYVDRYSHKALGVGSFMRFDPAHGVIEIGSIWMGPAMQRTRLSTEAIYLMLRHGFEDLGVRRLEWKCNDLNEPSRRAAIRFGFSFEGIFKQHMVVKGRNRDTAWYAMMDHEWPRLRQGFDHWLRPENFDENSREKVKLQLR